MKSTSCDRPAKLIVTEDLPDMDARYWHDLGHLWGVIWRVHHT